MGAFEDSGFIIVGLVPDAAQLRFSTPSPSGFPEHLERCLSSCVMCLGACARPSPGKCGGHSKMRLVWQTCCFMAPGNLVYYSIFDSFLSISTVARELQSHLYNRQYQLNLRTSAFLCKTSALPCDCVPKHKPGDESFYYRRLVCDSEVSLTQESKRSLFICCRCLLLASDLSGFFFYKKWPKIEPLRLSCPLGKW